MNKPPCTTGLPTERLTIRPFAQDDLLPIHRILDQTFGDGSATYDPVAIAERRSWLHWQIQCAEWFDKMHQPPYGDRAIVLNATGAVIGAAGYVPCLMPFEQVPSLQTERSVPGVCTAEFGLFWVIDPVQQRQGYATEAGRALIDYAFTHLRIKRIVATTEYENHASQAVMRKLGMMIERNPHSDPPWLQAVGILENPALA